MISAWRKLELTSHEYVTLERAGHAAVAAGNTIYVVGGRKGRTFFGDVIKFNSANGSWDVDCESSTSEFIPRAGHSATLIGRTIWVAGGSNNEAIFNDICCYDLDKRSWTYPKFKGDLGSLTRSAHGADIHPILSNSILVMGGYGGLGCTYVWLNDTIILHTDRLLVEAVHTMGPTPSPRGYHTMNTIPGSSCSVIIGGRTEEGRIQGSQMVVVLDASTHTWFTPQLLQDSTSILPYDSVHSTAAAAAPPARSSHCIAAVAAPPAARSSHRAVALPDRIIVHGGAASESDSDRLSDIATLVLLELSCPSVSRMFWSAMDEPSSGLPCPKGRAAHAACLIGSSVVILPGYAGRSSSSSSSSSHYVSDCWALDLAVEKQLPAASTSRAVTAASVRVLHKETRPSVPFITKPKSGSTVGLKVPSLVSAAAAAKLSSANFTEEARPAVSPPLGRLRGEKRSFDVAGFTSLWPHGTNNVINYQTKIPTVVERQSLQEDGTRQRVPGGYPAGLGASMDLHESTATHTKGSRDYQWLEDELRQVKLQNDQLQEQMKSAAQHVLSGQCDISVTSDLKATLELKAAELDKCRRLLREREEAAASADRLNAHLTTELNSLRDQVSQLQSAVHLSDAKTKECLRDLESERATRVKLEESLLSVNRAMEQGQARVQSDEAALSSARNAISLLQEQLRQVAREHEAVLERQGQELRGAQSRLHSTEQALTHARTEMVATQRRCSSLEDVNLKLGSERRRQDSELSALRQQVQTLKEAGRAGFEWSKQLEAQVKGGAAVLALFSPNFSDSTRP
ncbi:hypothetical protein CEUSTIGMA_g1706.t1 [Chlamydomonas eustigma]|uniref:Uncharacterized protein n=1 Tax=Chlamydomonas eustigma TaxID=1157962 RepID=A0A250WTV6_9CHLO|nr:hypothetical protein CEUSTIGMA_g1706.t1 [Chlamydomonas eustigma]|eukprot:GAX74257.1 hypothetical protein CEUSTIGMA_g1706.t1 [Chlamydomonas eustigma]